MLLFLRGGCDWPLQGPGQPLGAGEWEPGRELPGAGSCAAASGEESVRGAWGRAVPGGLRHSAPAPQAAGFHGRPGTVAQRGPEGHTAVRARPRPRPQWWVLQGPRSQEALVRVCLHRNAALARRGVIAPYFYFHESGNTLLSVRPFLHRCMLTPAPPQAQTSASLPRSWPSCHHRPALTWGHSSHARATQLCPPEPTV